MTGMLLLNALGGGGGGALHFVEGGHYLEPIVSLHNSDTAKCCDKHIYFQRKQLYYLCLPSQKGQLLKERICS